MEDVTTLGVGAEGFERRVKSRTNVGDLLVRQAPACQRISSQLEARCDDSLVGVLVRLAGPE
jgi:hypothetical protein